MARKKSPPDKAKHRLNKKYLLYTGGIYLCFYHHSYIIDKTFFKLQLGQFTRNYTQTVKRAADNKRRYAPGEGSIPPVLLSGFPKGCPLWHTTLLAKCSVLYLLAWLTGETGCGASCAPFAPAGKQAEFLRMGMSKKSACFQRTAAGI